ncbi:MAG: restriction endonuclease subunit S [Rubrobacteraceae bacterium]
MSSDRKVPAKHLYELRDFRYGSGEDRELLAVSVHRGVLPRSEITDKLHRADDLADYKRVEPDEIVINRMSAYQGALGIAKQRGIVSPEYLVLRAKKEVEPRYLSHLFKSSWFVSEMATRVRGIGSLDLGNVRTPRINPEDLGRIRVSIPSLAAQQAIADYLDAETARIDALIEKKRRLDDLIASRVAALIDTVTNEGKLTQVRRFISLRTSGPRGWAGRVESSGTPFIRSANLQVDSINIKWMGMAFVQEVESKEAERSRVQVGDVLVGITGANTGWVGFAEKIHDGAYVSQHVGLLRPRGVHPKWLAYSVFSPSSREQLLGGQYGGTKQQLSLDELAELAIHVPSLERQEELVVHLDQQRAITERLRTKLHCQIELLTEHRQALITAAVTGQLEIPGAA